MKWGDESLVQSSLVRRGPQGKTGAAPIVITDLAAAGGLNQTSWL